MLFVRIWLNALETASPRFKLLKQQFCKCHSLGELAVEISSLFKTHSAQLSRIHISISPKHCPRKKRNVTVLNSSSREDLRNSSCWPSAGLKKKNSNHKTKHVSLFPWWLSLYFVPWSWAHGKLRDLKERRWHCIFCLISVVIETLSFWIRLKNPVSASWSPNSEVQEG